MNDAKQLLENLCGKLTCGVVIEAISDAITSCESNFKSRKCMTWNFDTPLPIINDRGHFLRGRNDWNIGYETPVEKKLLLERLFDHSEMSLIIDHVDNFYYLPLSKKVCFLPNQNSLEVHACSNKFCDEHYELVPDRFWNARITINAACFGIVVENAGTHEYMRCNEWAYGAPGWVRSDAILNKDQIAVVVESFLENTGYPSGFTLVDWGHIFDNPYV